MHSGPGIEKIQGNSAQQKQKFAEPIVPIAYATKHSARETHWSTWGPWKSQRDPFFSIAPSSGWSTLGIFVWQTSHRWTKKVWHSDQAICTPGFGPWYGVQTDNLDVALQEY